MNDIYIYMIMIVLMLIVYGWASYNQNKTIFSDNYKRIKV